MRLIIAAIFLGSAEEVRGHGAMLTPRPRNAIDSELPAWSDGKNPRTGHIEPLVSF